MPLPKIYSSDRDQIITQLFTFNNALDFDEKNRRRSYENWRAYFAVDGGQWTDTRRLKLEVQNRHADQYNIIGPKVDALAGALFSEKFDLDWMPIDGIRDSLTEGVKAAYFADKEMCNYDRHFEQAVKDAMVYQGILKMKMSTKHNPLRNICFERVNPGFVILSPDWISNDSADMMECWEVFHMPVEDIIRKFDVSNSRMEAILENQRRYGRSFDVVPQRNPVELSRMGQRNDNWRVIERHWIEVIDTKRVIGKKLDSDTWMDFPITTDHARLEQYMIDNGLDPFSLQESPYEDRIHHVTTFAPELAEDTILEDGMSKVQPRRLPYFPISANRSDDGRVKGIVDDMLDIQRTINSRESKLTDMIATAQGGGKLVNKNLFEKPTDRERFRERANDPSYIEFVDGDELTKEKAIHYINSNQYPGQVINQLMRMWDIVDRVSKVPAALEAVSENSNESGVLFEKKLQTARLNTITIVNAIRDFRADLAEAYYHQFQLAYNGPERAFSTPDGKYSVTLNKRVFNDADGKVYIQNRPDMIPRCRVIATESKSNPNKQIRDRALFSEMHNFSLKSDATKSYAPFFFSKLIPTLELDEEDQEELKEINILERIKNKIRIRTEINTMLAQGKQNQLLGMQAEIGITKLLGQLDGNQGQAPVSQVAEDQLPQSQVPEENVEDAEFEEPLVSDGA